MRTAQAGDAEQFLRVLPQIDAETDYTLREPGEFALTLDQERIFLKNRLESPHDMFLMAAIDGRMIGALGFMGSPLRRYRHQGEFGMGVLKDFWGMGVGSALLSSMLQWVEQQAINRVSLKVAATNHRAIRLYHRFGFQEEGRLVKERRHADGRFEDTLIMARLLDE